MALVMRTTSYLGILSIIHPISVLALRIIAATLTTRIPMNDGKNRSEDFRDLRWDRKSRHWREPWEKERNGNERIHYGYEFRPTSWTIQYWLRYEQQLGLMQDHRIWDRILIIGNPLMISQSGTGSMDTRCFDRFPIHDADGRASTGGINLDLATHANDTTGRLFQTPAKSFIHKHLFMPEPDRKGKGKAREPITQNEPSGSVEPETQSPPQKPISSPSSEVPTTLSSSKATTKDTIRPADPLSDYTCPICFSAPTNATITPCGHICYGSCLFGAVKAGIQRAGMEHHPGGNRGRAAAPARYVLLWASCCLRCSMCFLKMPSLPLDYTWVGWEKRRGDWLESEGYFQLLILQLWSFIYRLSQFTLVDLNSLIGIS